MNLDTTGDNPVLHDKAITAWKLYQTIITTPKPIPPTFFQKLRARIELKLINWGLR